MDAGRTALTYINDRLQDAGYGCTRMCCEPMGCRHLRMRWVDWAATEQWRSAKGKS